MRYWWVNQNQTYRAEVRGNFMWSPKANADGSRSHFYENMQQVSPGDIVFSFCDTRIKAVGVVTGAAQTAPKPDFGNAGLNWSKEGWYVPIDYCVFERPIRPMADALIGLMGQSYYDCVAEVSAFPSGPDVDEGDSEEVLTAVGPTFREQLVKARRGQGVFRSSVLLTETSCRVTRVSDAKHLRASHIKPWRVATDAERLNGANGLLLSPHIDHLFDQGYISFSNTEQLLIVPEVRTSLLDRWGIDAGTNVGQFNREQQAFLDYHRAEVFNKSGR